MRTANPVGPGLVGQGPGLPGVASRQGVDANWNRRYWVGSAYLRNGVGVRIPGAGSNVVSSPNHASFQISGDIDLRINTKLRDWAAPAPVSSGTIVPLIQRYGQGVQVGWRFLLGLDGSLIFGCWVAGPSYTQATVAAPNFGDNETHWLRVTRSSATGVVKFYICPTEDGATWVQWGADQSTTAGAMLVATVTALTIGHDENNNWWGCPQIISNAQAWNGIEGSGGVNVFNANFAAQATGTTSFVESNGRTVTITSANLPWSTPGGWSEESGGVGGASTPTVASEVILDEWSPNLIFAASYTALCGAFDASRFTGLVSMDYANMVLAVQMGAVPDPRFVLSSAMSFSATTSGGVRVQFQGSGPVEGRINTAGKNMPGTNINGGPWRLDSDYTTNNTALSIFLNAGGWLRTNGYTVGSKTVPWVTALAGTSTTRRLELGSSTWWASSWQAGTAGLLLDPGTSTINVVGVGAGLTGYSGQRYNVVAFPAVQSSITTVGGLSSATAGGLEIAHLIVRNLSTSNYVGTTANPTAMWTFGANSGAWTITDMTIEGQPGSPVFVQGGGWGLASSAINVVNPPTLSNVTFVDVVAGGASAPWSGTNLGDGGGNTSITFPVSQTNYWVASTPGLTGSGLYCGTTNGSSSAGGTLRGTYASAPDSVPLSITGDIDLRVKFSGRICREHSGSQFLICKGNIPGGAVRAYNLRITYTGIPHFVISTNGTTESAHQATEALWPLSNYTAGWLRVTRVAAAGLVRFYWSLDGSTWTQLGADVTGTTGNIFDSAAPLWIGAGEGGNLSNSAYDGTLLRAQIYNGIDGTLAFDANFETVPAAALSFTESSVNAATVTVTAFAASSDGAHTDAAHWASTSGGAAGSGRVPLAHDDVVYDANSGTGRPQWDAPDVGRNVTGTGATVGVIDLFPRYIAGGAAAQTRIYGTFTAGTLSAVTWTTGSSSLDFCGRGSTFTHSIGSAFGWGDLSTTIVSTMRFYPLPSTTHALGSDLNTTWGIAQPQLLSTGGGTFTAGVHDVTCWSFVDGLTTQVRTVDFGTGTWTLTGASGNVLVIPNQANLTLAGTPTWVISESLDAVVKDGKWRVPQYGSDPSNTTRATNYVAADSTGGNGWNTPRPATALTGDFDVIVRVNADFWNLTNALMNTAFSSGSYTWGFVVTGSRPTLYVSTNGTTFTTYTATANVPFANGATGWLRVTRDRAGGQVKFWTCPDQMAVPTGGAWTQLGTTVASTTSTLFAGTTDLVVGGAGSTTASPVPRGLSVYHAQVSNVIGGAPVATLDFTAMDDYTLSTTDAQGNVWRSYQHAARTTRRVVGGTTIGYTVGSSNVWATPDSTALSITSDLELVIRCRPSTWTPTGGAFLINKFETTGNQRSYAWNISATGNLVFTRNATGSASNIVYTSTGTGLTAGVAYWLKMTYDQTDGAVSRCRFYYAADQATEPSVWTEIGTGVTSADVTGIYDSTAPLQIGIGSGAATTLNGEIWRAIVRNGIGGTTVFDADFSNLQDDTYAFRESSANNAVVYASSNGSTGSPGGRTVKNFIVNNKTLPGSALTLQGGGGGTLLIAGSSSPSHTHGYPALVSTGGKWLAAGDGSYGIQQFAAITWTTSATGPRNALVRGPAVTQSRWSSDGVVTVSYADVLYNDADGASIPFHDVNGFLFGTTDWDAPIEFYPSSVGVLTSQPAHSIAAQLALASDVVGILCAATTTDLVASTALQPNSAGVEVSVTTAGLTAEAAIAATVTGVLLGVPASDIASALTAQMTASGVLVATPTPDVAASVSLAAGAVDVLCELLGIDFVPLTTLAPVPVNVGTHTTEATIVVGSVTNAPAAAIVYVDPRGIRRVILGTIVTGPITMVPGVLSRTQTITVRERTLTIQFQEGAAHT